MNRSTLSRSAAVITMLALAAGAVWAEAGDDPAGAVRAFNAAITGRDLDTAVAQLATGGVQFTLRPLHDGVNPDKMVTPIADHWKMIIPVLFASTKTYSREVTVLNTEHHDDLATVWTETRTATVRADIDSESSNRFTEIYLLVDTPEGWKIASIADNRQATKIAGPSE